MSKWTILVAGYGAFLFDGTEAEAEDMRRHKARWERGVAKKRPATEAEIATGKADGCWNHHGFGNRFVYDDCRCPNDNCLIEAAERIA